MEQLLSALSYCNSQIKYYNFGISKEQFYEQKQAIIRSLIENPDIQVEFEQLELQDFSNMLIAIKFTVNGKSFRFHQAFHRNFYVKYLQKAIDIPIVHYHPNHIKMDKDIDEFVRCYHIISNYYDKISVQASPSEIIDVAHTLYPTLSFKKIYSKRKATRIHISGIWNEQVLDINVKFSNFRKHLNDNALDEYFQKLV